MLRTCFEKGFNFTVHYKAGLNIRITSFGKRDWKFFREKNGKILSWFRFAATKEIELGASDTLVYALVKSMYEELRLRRIGLLERDYPALMESVLRIFGGKVSQIKFVSIQNENV